MATRKRLARDSVGFARGELARAQAAVSEKRTKARIADRVSAEKYLLKMINQRKKRKAGKV